MMYIVGPLATLIAIIVFLADSTQTTYAGNFSYQSCKEILTRELGASSGEFTLTTNTKKSAIKVYCEMRLNGGGYTFLRPFDLAGLTNDELQAIFTDKSRVLLHARLTDGRQTYGVLKQLRKYRHIPLAVRLNNIVGYATSLNVPFLDSNYLFCGFLPSRIARRLTVQGLEVNDISIAFTNYDGLPNSYIAIFPNFFGFFKSPPISCAYDTTYPTYKRILSALRQVPSRRIIPEEYFSFFEANFGKCCLYGQADGRRGTAKCVAERNGTKQYRQNKNTSRQILNTPRPRPNYQIIAIGLGFR